MSSLLAVTASKGVVVVTDTLAVVGDGSGKPHTFTTKAHIVPHLNIIIVGTGVGGFADRWALYINTESNATGIDTLDPECVMVLPRMWNIFKLQQGVSFLRTVTIYHFGFSEESGKIRTFIYRSENGFTSEEVGYGFLTKPPIAIEAGCKLPRDAKLLMERQRLEQESLARAKRVYIGGRIQVHSLTKKGYKIFTHSLFDDYEADLASILSGV